MILSHRSTRVGKPAQAVLSDKDNSIIHHLSKHRILTTTQLVQSTGYLERTITYRLRRLYHAGIVGRTRPYAETGSAPLHWWLTPAGKRIIGDDGSSTRTSIPNPLFLAHTVATADLWTALNQHGLDVGIELAGWRRDEEGWEEWRDQGVVRRISPDAVAEVIVNGARITLFIEVDLATMTHARLRAKAFRYLDYAKEERWQGRHPWCPILLLLTTSEARTNTFLQAVKKIRPKPSPWGTYQPTDRFIVAACAEIRDPVRSVTDIVWRVEPDGAGINLRELLADYVPQEQRRIARETADAEEADRLAPIHSVDTWRGGSRHIGAALGDEEAARTLEVAASRGWPELRDWSLSHRDFVLGVDNWWRERWIHHNSHPHSAYPPSRALLRQFGALRAELWQEQAEIVLAMQKAQERQDPILRALANRLTRDELVSFGTLSGLEDFVQDVQAVQEEQLPGHAEKRADAIIGRRKCLPFLHRFRVTDEELGDAYDRENLDICTDCGIRVLRGSLAEPIRCRVCRGPLTSMMPSLEIPTLKDSVDHLSVRLRSIALARVEGKGIFERDTNRSRDLGQ